MQFDKVYIHKCYENELGYRNGSPGGAGRFLFISKKVTTFFPHLSKLELNDNVLIDVVDMNNNIVSSNYIYHNSKTATHNTKETRDEYRLYITSEIDTDRSLFKPNDIIAFTKYKIDEQLYFKLNLYSVENSDANYQQLNLLLEQEKQGIKDINHLLVNLNQVKFLEKDIEINDSKKILPTQTIDTMLSNQKHLFDNLEEIAEPNKEVPSDETGLIKSNNFRDIVLFAYMGKCAITGKSIDFESLSNLEAAHIMPQSHNGPDAIPNGMALSRDLHWAFDKGFFTIKFFDDTYLVDVHTNVKENEIMKEIDGIEIFKPSDPRFRLHNNALEYHQKHIFGTFKQIRSKVQ
ncbi:MAG: HNH endonuclease [Arcobacteraceae bacterium]|nr:HNH endonuclease [Arcobacteraceae bacterium]